MFNIKNQNYESTCHLEPRTILSVPSLLRIHSPSTQQFQHFLSCKQWREESIRRVFCWQFSFGLFSQYALTDSVVNKTARKDNITRQKEGFILRGGNRGGCKYFIVVMHICDVPELMVRHIWPLDINHWKVFHVVLIDQVSERSARLSLLHFQATFLIKNFVPGLKQIEYKLVNIFLISPSWGKFVKFSHRGGGGVHTISHFLKWPLPLNV